MTKQPKYPDITVELSGEDGNAFFVIGRVTKALRRAKVSPAEIEAFTREAMASDYDALLRTCMKWVDVT